MWLDFLLLAIGGAMLYYGAEWLVQGAAGLAIRLGVRPLLIGLTIVSYATSAPELAVSISAALRHDGALVLGNVFGSNIANIAVILGLTALIAPPRSDGSMARKELVILFMATLVAPLFFLNDRIERWEAALLVLGSLAFTWLTIQWSKNFPPDLGEVPKEEHRGKGRLIVIGSAGLAVLIGGGELFVRGAIGLAEVLGVSARVIGLTIVAFGTSLPELAASIVAALRGHSDLAIGNVVGSNIFNLLLILGVAGLIDPFQAEFSSMYVDMAFLWALTLIAIVMMSTERKITRLEGMFLTGTYVAFLATLAIQLP